MAVAGVQVCARAIADPKSERFFDCEKPSLSTRCACRGLATGGTADLDRPASAPDREGGETHPHMVSTQQRSITHYLAAPFEVIVRPVEFIGPPGRGARPGCHPVGRQCRQPNQCEGSMRSGRLSLSVWLLVVASMWVRTCCTDRRARRVW